MKPYAIIKTGGKQYTVSPGDILEIELLAGKQAGDKVQLSALVSNTESGLLVGTPELTDKVEATILQADRHKKVLVHKWRRRSQYRRRNGHRQGFHSIQIESIPGN
jgi:large subunit ribosomal protein L21